VRIKSYSIYACYNILYCYVRLYGLQQIRHDFRRVNAFIAFFIFIFSFIFMIIYSVTLLETRTNSRSYTITEHLMYIGTRHIYYYIQWQRARVINPRLRARELHIVMSYYIYITVNHTFINIGI